MKKIFLFVVLLAAILSAQSPKNQSLEKAKELLVNSSNAYNQVRIAKIKFEQSTKSDLTGQTQVNSGELWVGQKDEFRLKVPGVEIISDGISLWEYRESSKQVLVKSLLDLDRAFHPSQVLFKYLTCEPISSEKVSIDGKSLWHLKLNPKGKIKGIQSLEVWLDPQSLFPYKIQTLDAVDNVTTYIIPEFKTLNSAPAKTFEFNSMEGVELLDMR